MTWHVEGHMAAIMRMMKIKHAVLYINAPPCQGDMGCDKNLKHVLPVGYTLTVIKVNPNGGTMVKPFRGTGKGLEEPA